jgi:hypothetical protein
MQSPEAYPKNAPGDFIVNDFECIQCCAPEAEAPTLMDNDGTSCYFKKQPETPEEIEQALNAVHVCCIGAVRYCGSNQQIIERLNELEKKTQMRIAINHSETDNE